MKYFFSMVFLYGISLINPYKIPIYLHFHGKQQRHYQMVFLEEDKEIHVILLKGG